MIIRLLSQDFPGGPETKTLPSNAKGAGSIPGQGAKILQACVHAKSLQSCPTLCNPVDCSPSGSHMPLGQKNKQINNNKKKSNRSSIVTNSIKTLKMVHIKEKNL